VAEGRRPAWRADEVGDDEDEGATPDELGGQAEQVDQPRDGRVCCGRAGEQPVQKVEHVAPTAPRGDDGNPPLRTAVIEQGSHAVAVARQQAGEHTDELGRRGPLGRAPRAEVHRCRHVEQEPRGDLAVLVVLPHVGRPEARRHVPVDVPDVVVILVLAQVRQVEPGAAKQGPVVALQEPIEAPDHGPLEPAQQLFRMARRL
jgi:hypothetical protein